MHGLHLLYVIYTASTPAQETHTFLLLPATLFSTRGNERGNITTLFSAGKAHHDGCPGCSQVQRLELNKGIPYKEFFFVGVTTLASCMYTYMNSYCISHAVLVSPIHWTRFCYYFLIIANSHCGVSKITSCASLQ